MNVYLIYFKHYKTQIKAVDLNAAKLEALNVFKPKKNQLPMLGAWRLNPDDFSYAQEQF